VIGEYAVAMMCKDDRVLHLPGHVHGTALCGQNMDDNWLIGPFEVIADKAEYTCERCFG
jgi:hypothetical protein